ncbi:hypothetical protein NDU88_008884 [Pleurodeles waltl]|uniref:Uncharacterized protein n=1 Tax=Pleurodeles waltl TaxID=8319 RepID=A0AAV7PVN7_PLEWA|nr:hypothetical protein NDU88_008884 [Pleurodeles waltl]
MYWRDGQKQDTKGRRMTLGALKDFWPSTRMCQAWDSSPLTLRITSPVVKSREPCGGHEKCTSQVRQYHSGSIGPLWTRLPFSAAPAECMQRMPKGRFQLPSDAHWGGSTSEASVSIDAAPRDWFRCPML